jgi:hypothetical protein
LSLAQKMIPNCIFPGRINNAIILSLFSLNGCVSYQWGEAIAFFLAKGEASIIKRNSIIYNCLFKFMFFMNIS